MDKTIEDQLYDAVSRNDLNNVRKNLCKDVNINTICSSGLTPLGAAAHLGNISICETLIENYKRSSESREDEFSTPKHKKLCIDFSNNERSEGTIGLKNVGYFVVQKDLDLVNDSELGDGPTPEGMEGLEWDVEIKEETDESPNDSYSCLYRWYADILNRTSDLLKKAAPDIGDLDQIDRYGRTALHYASERGHISIVELLIAAGCNVNQTSSDNVSALHLAANIGNCDVVKLLLNAGARVNHITNLKTTALHFAACQGHIKLMQSLLHAGANVDALDTFDRTPLVLAVSQQQAKAVELLVRHSARVNIDDVNGYTPLCEAVWINSLPIVHTLIMAGAKVTQSHFLLHYSVVNNDLNITKLLVSAGSVVNLRDQDGNTPIILAAKNGQVDTVKYLIDHGAMVNLPNTVTGATAVYEAVENINDVDYLKFQSVLELLFVRGACLEMESYWDTPLFRALFLQKTQIAALLIQYGADVNFCDSRIHVDNMNIARKNKDLIIVKMLVYAGYDLRNIPDVRTTAGALEAISDWLLYTKYNPLTLMDLCRIRIRKQLGKKVYFKIHSLGLPRQLQRFLHLDFIH